MAIDKITVSTVTGLQTELDNSKINPEFSGTEAAKLPNGTTAQRANAKDGDIRFNTTSSLAEYYDGNTWKSIDSPPAVSSISPTTETDASANIVITGSNFASNVTVKFVGNDGTEYPSPSVSRDSNTQITATTPSTALSVANEPYDVVVTNTSSSLAGTLADALDAGGVPAFTTAAGSHTIYDSARGTSFDAGATDPDGDTITYSVTAGSLPAGASISSSTGAITGFSAVGSNTSSTFTVSAATSSDTSTRQFTLAVQAPVITSYTSTGSFTFSVPSSISSVDVLVVAAGGGSGVDNGGGGGGGGLIYRPAFPVTPGGSISGTVGAQSPGGSQGGPWSNNPSVKSQDGGDSTFGTLTSKGGGTGGSWGPGSPATAGAPGGSGGGEARYQSSGGGGAGTQPQQPGDSATYGFGTNGGSAGPNSQPGSGGGGGGAGGTGVYRTAAGGQGGAGKVYAISGSSVTYSYGGAGGAQNLSNGENGNGQYNNGQNGINGQDNRGGGGSAGSGGGSEQTGRGAPGIVIVKY